MAKQLITNQVIFTPSTGVLDFSSIPGFSIKKLYAIINITRNTPIYIAGAPGFGAQQHASSSNRIAVDFNTSTHSANDILNIYYDVTQNDPALTVPGTATNALENGGNLDTISANTNQILAELRVMNYILATGLNISTDEVDRLRDDMQNVSVYP